MKQIKEFKGDYRFLSNFYIGNPIVLNGSASFQTSEHLYQAFKTTDVEEMLEIAACSSPGKAKRLGAKITLRSDWDAVKDRVMEICTVRKFGANPELLNALIATGDAELIEGNTWHDNYWGVCSCDECQGLDQKNKLGYTLMRYRDMMRPWYIIDI